MLLSSQKYITKGYVYDFLHPWLHQGLLTSGGKKLVVEDLKNSELSFERNLNLKYVISVPKFSDNFIIMSC